MPPRNTVRNRAAATGPRPTAPPPQPSRAAPQEACRTTALSCLTLCRPPLRHSVPAGSVPAACLRVRFRRAAAAAGSGSAAVYCAGALPHGAEVHCNTVPRPYPARFATHPADQRRCGYGGHHARHHGAARPAAQPQRLSAAVHLVRQPSALSAVLPPCAPRATHSRLPFCPSHPAPPRFVSIEYTQPEYVQLAYMKGHEIATHTVHHVGLPNATEIVGARTWLNEVLLCWGGQRLEGAAGATSGNGASGWLAGMGQSRPH